MTPGRSARGLTLIEVLVAMTMLAIISAAALALLPTIVDTNRSAAEEQAATNRAKSFFETLDGTELDTSEWTVETGIEGSFAGATVPAGCSVDLSTPRSGIWRVGLACVDLDEQMVLEVGDTP